MSSAIRVLCLSTNGIMVDGITSWMKSTFSAMDLNGLEISTTAFEECPSDVIDSVRRCGIEVIIVPNRKKRPLKYMLAFRDLLRTGHFDVIHVCCNSAMAAFELAVAKKCVSRMRIAHSRNTMCSHRFASFLLNPLFQTCVTDRYACGEDAGKWLFGKRSFTVIPNGKNLSAYGFSSEVRKAVRKELGLADDEIAFGHVGGFNEQKNHIKLLEVFAELRQRNASSKLFLVGEGRLIHEVEETAEALGVAEFISFLGRRDDVPRLLNGLDCMIFPSLYEGFPNVVLEWQLNGLPIVMSDTITDECVITPLVSQVSLDSSACEWADAVDRAMKGRDRVDASYTARKAAKAAGYDIYENAALLRRLYLEGAKRCK